MTRKNLVRRITEAITATPAYAGRMPDTIRVSIAADVIESTWEVAGQLKAVECRRLSTGTAIYFREYDVEGSTYIEYDAESGAPVRQERYDASGRIVERRVCGW